MKVRFYDAGAVRKEIRQTVKDTIAFMLHLIAWYLRDELGWGHDRIERCMDWMDEHAKQYMGTDGEVSLTDVHDMLIKEVGINITFDKERMK